KLLERAQGIVRGALTLFCRLFLSIAGGSLTRYCQWCNCAFYNSIFRIRGGWLPILDLTSGSDAMQVFTHDLVHRLVAFSVPAGGKFRNVQNSYYPRTSGCHSLSREERG